MSEITFSLLMVASSLLIALSVRDCQLRKRRLADVDTSKLGEYFAEARNQPYANACFTIKEGELAGPYCLIALEP